MLLESTNTGKKRYSLLMGHSERVSLYQYNHCSVEALILKRNQYSNDDNLESTVLGEKDVVTKYHSSAKYALD